MSRDLFHPRWDIHVAGVYHDVTDFLGHQGTPTGRGSADTANVFGVGVVDDYLAVIGMVILSRDHFVSVYILPVALGYVPDCAGSIPA